MSETVQWKERKEGEMKMWLNNKMYYTSMKKNLNAKQHWADEVADVASKGSDRQIHTENCLKIW